MSSQMTLAESVETRELEARDPPAGQRRVTGAQWTLTALRCECGADITEWHTNTRARSLVRAYGGEDGRVPHCPACVSARSGEDGAIQTVPKAVRQSEGESTIERMEPERKLEVILRGGVE